MPFHEKHDDNERIPPVLQKTNWSLWKIICTYHFEISFPTIVAFFLALIGMGMVASTIIVLLSAPIQIAILQQQPLTKKNYFQLTFSLKFLKWIGLFIITSLIVGVLFEVMSLSSVPVTVVKILTACVLSLIYFKVSPIYMYIATSTHQQLLANKDILYITGAILLSVLSSALFPILPTLELWQQLPIVFINITCFTISHYITTLCLIRRLKIKEANRMTNNDETETSSL